MSTLDKLAKEVKTAAFTKAYTKDKNEAIEDVIGRRLKAAERAAVKELSHNKLKTVVAALRPRGAGPHPPE